MLRCSAHAGTFLFGGKERKALDLAQEAISNLEQQKKERMYLHMGFLQLKAEGSPTLVPEVGTFERSVTSRPTLSSQYLHFTITY